LDKQIRVARADVAKLERELGAAADMQCVRDRRLAMPSLVRRSNAAPKQ
jgi:hypothetical protein